MGKLTLVTGGARSGKSSFAERLAGEHGGKVVYIATAIVFDDEMTDRVRRHRNRRPPCWETLELPYGLPIENAKEKRSNESLTAKTREQLCGAPHEVSGGFFVPTDLHHEELRAGSILERAELVLVDCMTVLISNIMLREIKDWEDGNVGTEQIEAVKTKVFSCVDQIIGLTTSCPASEILIVTNEVGMGLVPPYVLGRAFRDFAGWANQRIASAANAVYLCVSGIPVKIK